MKKRSFSNICVLPYIQICGCLKGLLLVVVCLFAVFHLFCIAFHWMVQDHAVVVKVFIYFVLFRITSHFSSGNFTILTPISTTLLVKYECLLFATAVTPLMQRLPVIEKSYHAPVRQIQGFKIYSKIYLIGLTFSEIVLIHHDST